MTVETLEVQESRVVKRIAEEGRKRQHRLSDCGDIRGSTLLGAITVNPGFKVFRSKRRSSELKSCERWW